MQTANWPNLIWCLLQLSLFVLTINIKSVSANPTHKKSFFIFQPATKTLAFAPLQLAEPISVPSSLVRDLSEGLNNKKRQLEVIFSQHHDAADFGNAQIINVAQVPTPAIQIPRPPQEPRDEKFPSTLPQPANLQSPTPENTQQESLCPKTSNDGGQENSSILNQITVTEFKFLDGKYPFKGNQALTLEYLKKLTQPYLNQPISLEKLLSISSEIAKHYSGKEGEEYATSGAIVDIPTETQNTCRGSVIIRVIEGELKDIKVTFFDPNKKNPAEISTKLNPEYVRSRLALAASKPLNIKKLQEALQLLQINPLIKSVTARLSSGINPGESILEVQIQEANSFSTALTIDNGRTPSVSSLERRAFVREANFLGIGDRLSFGYTNTDGSNSFDASYTLPLNPREGTLSFTYSNSENRVIEPPFNDINKDGNGEDIKSSSRSYELTLRQPLTRKIMTIKNNNSTSQSTFAELALGLTASLRESQTTLLDIPFPLSAGADNNGVTRIFALRFFQDWSQQNAQGVIAFRSQFNFGFHAFDSTINEQIPGLKEVISDSRFFSWLGQALWLNLLGEDKYKLLRLRANVQLADRALPSAEQITFGGLGSVRGYRQDILQTDNGVFVTGEVELPVLYAFNNTAVLQVIPFVDYGISWNSSGNANPSPNSLAALGFGLQWRQGNNFTARFDWGIPLISAESRGRTWQENGLYFSVQWNPF
ncbi:MAG: ShlB/FhaC/HecB family hemolysin secretion/activation protein [Gloeotrichia echinulata IR180]|jgi:hemolysin activation/secretion protein